jgi:hypothetical protein
MQATTMKPMIARTADECIDAVPDLLSNCFIWSVLDGYPMTVLASKLVLNLRIRFQKQTFARQTAMSALLHDSDWESEFPQKIISALPPKADMCGANHHVCFGPKADLILVRVSAFDDCSSD